MELSLPLALLLFAAGVGMVLFFSEKLVEATVGTSLHFGISTFLISVIFIGFDPENLAVGSVASFDNITGIALGTILGSAMVAIALAFGLTALIAPLKFERLSKQTLMVPLLAVLLLGICSVDGLISRIDGTLLLAGYMAAIAFLIYRSNNGSDIKPTGEVAESLNEAKELNRWKSAGLLGVSLVAILIGSELLITGTDFMLEYWTLSETVVGMTVLALVISIEEVARELPAALKGHPEIAYGNVAGSVLAFFLFNAGIIALIRPIPINTAAITFYLPVCIGTTLFLTITMFTRSVPRWAGATLVGLYLLFFIGGFYL